MELDILIDDEQLKVKQTIVESEDNFNRRLIFIFSAINLNILPERAKTLSLCFLNRILFGTVYSPDLELEINIVNSSNE